MSDLKPTTPLGASTGRVDHLGDVTLRENPDTALASFAARTGQERKAADTLAEYLGQNVPGVGQSILAQPGAFWMGPNQWMVMADYGTHEHLADDLAQKAAGVASVTEQSDAWCRFDLEGEGLASVFERLCPVPMRSHSGGEATRTTIDHIGCFVLYQDARNVSVFGPRSFASSLHHALVTAIHSAL